MFRLRTPGLLAAGGLALLAGCKHHHHEPAMDAPMAHAPILPDGSQVVMDYPGVVGMIAGPVPRPSMAPVAQPVSEAPAVKGPVGELPPPDYAKIPEAKPMSRPAADVPALVVPLTKKADPEPVTATGPTLTGLPAATTPDPFVAAPVRTFQPATVTEVVAPPKDTTPELQPMKLTAGERFGHAADFKWVAGALDRHQKGGFWTLRYADYAADDPWGGKVRLIDDPRLAAFRNGDYVYVEGHMMAPPAGAETTGYPPFRIGSIQPVR